MYKLLSKIFSNPDNVIPKSSLLPEQSEVVDVGGKIQEKIKKLFRGSLAIRQVDAGSDNACEQELVALSNAFYDVERFGIHFVASPKHADMLMVTGPVTRNMAEALKEPMMRHRTKDNSSCRRYSYRWRNLQRNVRFA